MLSAKKKKDAHDQESKIQEKGKKERENAT